MKMKKSIATSAIAAVLSLLVLLIGATAAHAAEGTADASANANANVNTNVEVKTGVMPDSFLYGLQTAIDRINLALTFDSSAKAEKGLKIARKRLLEVQAMVNEDKLDAAKIAQKEHDRVLAAVEKAVRKLAKSEAKEEVNEEIKLEKELEEHDKEVDTIRGNLEVRMKVKGEITADQQALIDSILDSLQNKTGEVRITIENKKNQTRTRIEITEGKTRKEAENEVEEIENESGLLAVRKERAEARINATAQALADIKTKLLSSNLTVNSRAAVQLVLEADIKLQAARQAFSESKFGEAFGQATAAGRLVRNADRIINLTEQIKEKIGTAQVITVSARVVGNQTEVSVSLNFVTDSTSSSAIAQQIKDRLNLSKENISALLQVKNRSALLGEKLAAEAGVMDGFTIVKSQYRFDLNTTSQADLADAIAQKLSALTAESISGALEVKTAEAADVKISEGDEDEHENDNENGSNLHAEQEAEAHASIGNIAKVRLGVSGVVKAGRSNRDE